MDLRPYQQKAKEMVLDSWSQGVQKSLLVLPTGTGKTIVFSDIAKEQVLKGERVLILAHRGELLEQASDKLFKSTGLKTSLEKAESSCMNEIFRVVVGSVQTLMREARLNQFPKDYFDTIIVDEAHHILSPSYQNVMKHFDKAKILGVTATPDRGDMQNLGKFFEKLAYEYSIVQAIKDGYLSPIKALTIPLELDISNLTLSGGDFKAADIGTALDPYLYQIADEMVTYAKGRKTVVFLPLIATSQKFRDILNSKGFRACEVNGMSKDRAEILEAFNNDEYNVLCNSMLLTEGWDEPSVDCIVVLRPTKIRSLYSQMVGRGTRLFPGKDHLLLLDFLWHTERHELCRPGHLITADDEVARKITKNSDDEAQDLIEMLGDATQDVLADREEALAKKLAEMRKRKQALVDPLQYEMSIQAEDLASYVPSFGWEMEKPTTKQLEALEKKGILPDVVENAGKASLILDRLNKRAEEGLSTPKQIRLLERYGFKKVGMWEFDEANKMISRISFAGWRIPKGISAAEYLPQSLKREEGSDLEEETGGY